MLLNHEELFVATIRDLRNKIRIGKEYELIRACGLCRHLLMDRPSALYDDANRKYKLKLKFEIADFSNHPSSKIRTDIGLKTSEPVASLPRKSVSLDEFLATVVLNISEIDYSVKDILRAASHYYGGIHSGGPKEYQHLLDVLNAWADSKEKLTLMAIRGICKVILKAMEPLELTITSHTI